MLEVSIVGYPDLKLGERIYAVVVPSLGEMVALEDLTVYFQEKGVAKYKHPEKLLVV